MVGPHQGEEPKIWPQSSIETFVRRVRDAVEKSTNIFSCIREFHGGGGENLPITKQGVHRAILGDEIKSHDRNTSAPNVRFCSATEVPLHRDSENFIWKLKFSQVAL
jgi:hypothetical protein